MKNLYQASDGKIFETELDCINHENGINKPLFEKSKFFTSYLGELEQYQGFVEYIYIHPSEWDKMRVFLRTKNRTLKETSNIGIYQCYCMTFVPIEKRCEAVRKQLKDIQRTIKQQNDIIKFILEKTEDQNP